MAHLINQREMTMRSINLRSFFFSLTLLATAATEAVAQAPSPDGPGGPEDDKSYSWGLGLAGMAQQKAYTDIDVEYQPIPIIYFENRWVQLLGPSLEFKIPGFTFSEDNELSFGARIEFDGGGYKGSDAPILSGMAKRKDSFLAGGAAKWETPWFSLSADAMFDANSASEGSLFSLGIERTFFYGQHLMITPSVEATKLDKKYTDYYYGVRPEEARAGRAAYRPGSTVNTSVGLRVDYMFDEHHALLLQTEYTALGSKIKDSPITDRSGESMVMLGYLYRF
ncbi:MAG: MipA/OmpV family protein [Steroidobacteraceae bacterium]